MDDLLDVKQTAEYLGKSAASIRLIAGEGLLKAIKINGRAHFEKRDLDNFKRQQYPEGLTISDIAKRYGKAFNTVDDHFKRLHVKTCGIHRRRGRVFDEATVSYFAQLLDWELPQHPPGSQKDER